MFWCADDWLAMFPTVCRVEANTSAVTPRIKYSERLKRLYYEITFDVILLFGLTELQAQIAYTDSSVTQGIRKDTFADGMLEVY
jgi:hypothetical protein